MPADLSGLTPEAEQRLRLALDELRRSGVRFSVTSAFRSPEKQAQLYADRANNPYPVAPPGHSTHEQGIAADLALADEAQRTKATQILAKHGWNWTLGPKDRVHYQFGGKPVDLYQQQHEQGLSDAAAAFTRTVKPPPAERSEPGLSDAAASFAATVKPRGAAPTGGLSDAASAFAATVKPSPSAKPATKPAGLQLSPALVTQGATVTLPQDRGAAPNAGGAYFPTSTAEDPGAALRTFTRGAFSMDNALNAAASSVAKRVRKQGAGALLSGETYGQAAHAGHEALVDLHHDVPPTAIRDVFGLEKGKSNRAAYNVAAVADYVTSGLLAPSNVIMGPAFETITPVVKAGVRGAAKLAVRGAERLAPEATAATTRAITGAAERIGVGPAARAGRQVTKQYRIDLDTRLQEIGQVAREVRDATVRARKGSAVVDQAERAFAQANGGKSRLQVLTERYVTDPHGALRQAANAGIDPQLVKQFGERIVSHADQTLNLLERAKVIKPRTQSGPLFIPGGTERNQFLSRYASELYGRAQGTTLGAAGESAFAGSNIRAVRKAALANLTDRLASTSEHAATVTADQPLRPGWAQLPDEAVYGPLRTMQVPSPVARLLQAEAHRGPAAPAGDEVAAAGKRVGDLWRKVVGGVKVGYISNPATLSMNMGSNAVAAEIAARRNGLSPIRVVKAMPGAVKEVWTFLRTGHMSPEIAEFSRYSDAFLNSMASTAGVAAPKTAAAMAGTGGRVLRIGGAGVYFPPAREMGTKALGSLASLHGASEQASKLALYKALKPKLGPEGAAAAVEKHLFDYGDRNALLEWADRHGLWIFNSFPLKATELLFDTLQHRPDLVMRYPRLASLLRQDMGAEEDYANLPAYRKGPLTFPVGGGKFIDASRAFPFTDALGLPETVGRIRREGFTDEDLRGLAGRALPTAALGIMLNRDVQTGKEIAKPGLPPGEDLRLKGEAFVRNYAPPLFTRNIPGIVAAARGVPTKPGRFGEAQPLPEAILQYGFGLPTVRGEGLDARTERLKPQTEQHAAQSDAWLEQVDAELDAGRLQITPAFVERAAHETNPQQLHALTMQANKRLRELREDASLFDSSGKLSTDGKARLRRLLEWRTALAKRLEMLPQR